MPTKEQILEAAATSPEAKQALEKLFPEYFEGIDLSKCVLHDVEEIGFNYNDKFLLWASIESGFKSFALSGNYKWELKYNNNIECYYLTPTKK